MAQERKNYGDAKWAQAPLLDANGFLDTEGQFLGAEKETGQHIIHNGEEHILTVSPPGGGKTVAVALPSLLFNRGSMVVTDPKGTLTAQTSRFRGEELGQKIIVLNPWADEITTELGVDLGSTGFNPLAILKPGDPSVIENAEMIATILCPTPPKVDPSWTQRAASILTGCLLFLTFTSDEPPTLPRLYDLVRQDPDGWEDLAQAMGSVEGIDLVSYANEIKSPLKSGRQFAGIEQAMHNATGIYNPQKLLADQVSRDEFDPGILKREDVTVYIVIPSNRRESNAGWLNLVVSMLAEAVGRPGQSRRVTMLCEEFANLGYTKIPRMLAEYREAGLRGHLILQSTHQLANIYGIDGKAEIMNLCGIKQYFGINDLREAQEIEAIMGTYTETEGVKNTAGMAVPLMRVQDIMKLPKQQQIILMQGQMKPVKAYLRPYFTDQDMLDRSDPNPMLESHEENTVTDDAPEEEKPKKEAVYFNIPKRPKKPSGEAPMSTVREELISIGTVNAIWVFIVWMAGISGGVWFLGVIAITGFFGYRAFRTHKQRLKWEKYTDELEAYKAMQ